MELNLRVQDKVGKLALAKTISSPYFCFTFSFVPERLERYKYIYAIIISMVMYYMTERPRV